MSTYAANKILELLVGKTAFATPTATIGLSTANPLDDGSGISEPSGNGYSRVTTSGSDWAAASSKSISNAVAIAFPEATGSWGTITHFFAVDGSSNLLFYGALTSSVSPMAGEIVRFPAGNLTGTVP